MRIRIQSFSKQLNMKIGSYQMVFGKLPGQLFKKIIPPRDFRGRKGMRDSDLETAYFQIGSAIIAHRDLSSILDLVVQESLNSLRAHRATIFLMDEESGSLKSRSTNTLKPLYRHMGLNEEKEIARKAIRQAKSFFLREPRDFEEFFEYRERGWKVSSLLSIPLSSQRKPVGALSTILINEKRRFSARDLKYLFFFGNLASLAMENTRLVEELNKEISSRKIFERCLDDILCRVQGLFGKGGWDNEAHLENSLPIEIATEQRPFGNQTMKKVNWVDGSLSPGREIGPNRQDVTEESLPSV